ncbi:uncharacterized protein LOC123299092 [Chrysoperla carnea]|uniref:uncharacterized protein LOC123299092 n=1 Tax=Chrysoperla carnea TaxID=189513 RepID=UPI001D0893D8|nr:uncharacterized protein LOC123299092 [Chrysoperla carnea]
MHYRCLFLMVIFSCTTFSHGRNSPAVATGSRRSEKFKSVSNSISQPRSQGSDDNGDNAPIKFDPLDHVYFHKTITKVVKPEKQKRPNKSTQKKPALSSNNKGKKKHHLSIMIQE